MEAMEYLHFEKFKVLKTKLKNEWLLRDGCHLVDNKLYKLNDKKIKTFFSNDFMLFFVGIL